jgi:hypothetical protein
MSYPWMITFSDLTDSVVKKFGDTYLSSTPSSDKNYYDMTAEKFINFIGAMNLNDASISYLSRTGTNKPHYLLIQWLITCFQMQVCFDKIGLNDVEMQYDKYYMKYKVYRDELNGLSRMLKYETVISGQVQQNQTRAANTIEVMY